MREKLRANSGGEKASHRRLQLVLKIAEGETETTYDFSWKETNDEGTTRET